MRSILEALKSVLGFNSNRAVKSLFLPRPKKRETKPKRRANKVKSRRKMAAASRKRNRIA